MSHPLQLPAWNDLTNEQRSELRDLAAYWLDDNPWPEPSDVAGAIYNAVRDKVRCPLPPLISRFHSVQTDPDADVTSAESPGSSPTAAASAQAAAMTPCGCYRCLTESGETVNGFPITATRMVVCITCGNKRCPHATDHRFARTGSNDLNQTGSRYAEGWSKPVDWRGVDRDVGGRLVREAWVRWALTQPNPKPSWLVPYDRLDEPDKEADRQIAESLFAAFQSTGGSSLQKMQIAPDGPSLLAVELERLSAIWMVMSEQQTPGVCADIALFAMQNRAAIIDALKAEPGGWREIANAPPPSKGYFVGWAGDYPKAWNCAKYHLAVGSTDARPPWPVMRAEAEKITHWLLLPAPPVEEG